MNSENFYDFVGASMATPGASMTLTSQNLFSHPGPQCPACGKRNPIADHKDGAQAPCSACKITLQAGTPAPGVRVWTVINDS